MTGMLRDADGRLDCVLVAVVVAINAMVFVNALLHSPFVGYDALAHLEYIRVLSEGRLPGPEETTEFFVAPLPYVAPALVAAVGAPLLAVYKLAQLQNVVWSIGLTFTIVQLCRRLQPESRALPLWTLVVLGSLPVYYRTFAMVRGEPLAAFLIVLLVERCVALAPRGVSWRAAATIGGVAGLALLSKQWSALAVAPAFVWMLWRCPRDVARLAAAGAVAVLLCGWFYASLQARFGSIAAFNESPAPSLRLSNRPASFLAAFPARELVTTPVRDAFGPEDAVPLLPTLHADSWGDYWCYWVVRGQDAETGEWLSGDLVGTPGSIHNRDRLAPYLGRANVAGAAPTALMLAGIVVALRRKDGTTLAAMIVAATLVGYVALLLLYPLLSIKSGYQLHAAPLLALLAAVALIALPPRARLAAQALIVLAAAHNAPLFVTRYFGW